jgi:DNA-binding HxlR family transcriptional regulator
MKQIIPRSTCPLSFALDLLGDKWSLLIIRDMIIYNKVSYGEFLQSDEKIATNILADRLAILEKHGFITRRISDIKKTKVIYKLTEMAVDLVPIIMECYIWGSKYCLADDMSLLVKLHKNKELVIQEYQEKIKQALKTE